VPFALEVGSQLLEFGFPSLRTLALRVRLPLAALRPLALRGRLASVRVSIGFRDVSSGD
jgi:hypothetical protein